MSAGKTPLIGSFIGRRFTTRFDATAWNRSSRAESMQQPGWYLQRLRRHVGRRGRAIVSRAACALVSQQFVPHEVPPRDAFAHRPAFPAAVRVAGAGHADRRRRAHPRGPIHFFDLDDCDLGDPPQWNRDPLTQRVAGSRRASAIDYRDEREVGNIKYLWEPNRHLHLPTAGAGACAHRRLRATRSASRRRSIRGSSNARRAADRTG